MQYRSIMSVKAQANSSILKTDQIMSQLNDEMDKSAMLSNEIENLDKKKEDLINRYLLTDESSQQLRDMRQQAMLLAGLTDVKGPGITITLNDAKVTWFDSSRHIIHDRDIQFIINDLKSAGAQAISINDERICAMSEQVCAGPTILINQNRYTVPFVIKAIGDPDELYNFMINTDYLNAMLQDSIQISVEKSSEILIKKYAGNLDINDTTSKLEVVQ